MSQKQLMSIIALRYFSTANCILEKEIKFRYSSRTLEQFQKASSVIVPEQTITLNDQYFSNELLASKDMWLRKRNDLWQLKSPHIRESFKNIRIESYKEIDSEALIVKELSTVFNTDMNKCVALRELLIKLNIVPLTPLTTIRESFICDKGEIRVDFDYCVELDYRIGEAELLVPIDNAAATLVQFCKRYQLCYSTTPPIGKVVMQMKRFYPHLFVASQTRE
eukprot:GHVL01009210.1.p2 GENE.GHVL01009210.1~~GHVL01009210.1.p2  ORF type:complete len:222 (+),score=20.75 GHVL01009210.1:388-1053(+)